MNINKTLEVNEYKKTYVNDTYKYIIPYFTKKNKDFYNNFWKNKTQWLAFGIDDHNNSHGLNLYCLSKIQSGYNIINLINDESFITEYMYDVRKPQLNMLVFDCKKIPLFIEGSYSQLYNLSEIESSFSKTFVKKDGTEYYNPIRQVLEKDLNYKNVFINKIQKDFNLDSNEGLEPSEYAYPPVLSNEIFNYKE